MSTEILAPAGGESSAYAALKSGADAIYLGLTQFSARESAENFDVEALSRTVRLAHILGAKVYVCLNTLVKDGETERFFESVRLAYNAGADAILMQDIFLGREIKRAYPEITLHLSTQAGCANTYGAQLAKEFGFSRVVLARETPLAEIKRISKIIETEAFVQGALCTAFSGQCYLSSYVGGNSGNRGRCKQPCRKRYKIDRKGFEEYAYALSTSDLCVGERVKELVDAGVTSLKIEGRLRREEYVAAAVKYYRALLDGTPADRAFSALKRAYNRGDYTNGLAFGQRGDFLSRAVQGHIGEKVGEVSLVQGKYFCKSNFPARKGDGFKILRKGMELGGALFTETGKGGFYLSASARLLAGDEVRLTTDTAGAKEIIAPVKKRIVRVRVRLQRGQVPHAECEGFCYAGTAKAEEAKSAPLTAEEIISNFNKTEIFSPLVEVETDGVFLAKSALNGFRREFYEGLANHLAPAREPLPVREISATVTPEVGRLTAAIGQEADITVFKPQDYANISPPTGKGERYLWLPPLFTQEDEALIKDKIPLFDGLYCEGSYGILLAEKYNKPLFAGAGFNLTNRFAVAGVSEYAKYFVLSREISLAEQKALMAKGAFVLAAGGVNVMELCYCPFSCTCKSCDKREFYTLTDESGRQFPMRRYRMSEGRCRFEIYNCVPLSLPETECSRLADCTTDKGALSYCINPAAAPQGATKGHAVRSML